MKNSKLSSIKLFDESNRGAWTLAVSMFSLGEIYDLEKDNLFFRLQIKRGMDLKELSRIRKQRHLTPKELGSISLGIFNFFEKYPKMLKVTLEDKDWRLFNIICSETNLTWPDASHLTSALGIADILLTADTEFKKESEAFLRNKNLWDEFRVCKPDEVFDNLRDIGFDY